MSRRINYNHVVFANQSHMFVASFSDFNRPESRNPVVELGTQAFRGDPRLFNAQKARSSQNTEEVGIPIGMDSEPPKVFVPTNKNMS